MAKHKRINYSDIPATDAAFWKDAVIHEPKAKQIVTIRLDPNVVEWFKEGGSRYQTKINAVLKSYMNAHMGVKAGDGVVANLSLGARKTHSSKKAVTGVKKHHKKAS